MTTTSSSSSESCGEAAACWACADQANADNETLKKVASFYYDDKVQEAEKTETKGTAVPTKVDQQELKDLLARYSQDLKEQTK